MQVPDLVVAVGSLHDDDESTVGEGCCVDVTVETTVTNVDGPPAHGPGHGAPDCRKGGSRPNCLAACLAVALQAGREHFGFPFHVTSVGSALVALTSHSF
jgi:hypothetical protein